MLVDRVEETKQIERALLAAAEGTSGALVLHGEAGIGKTALLGWAVERARQAGMQLTRVVGLEAEREFGYAALHQLLTPLLPSRSSLPAPQRRALETVLGLDEGSAPNRFLVGLATLTLLTDAAARRPMLCVVDDAEWIDDPSVELIGFVARRLQADRVAVLVALRDGEAALSSWDGLPRLELAGLPDDHAAELLSATIGRPIDPDVCRRALAEGGGNPLALLELATDVAAHGRETPGRPLRSAGRLSERYRARIGALPEDARTLLLLASISTLGDPERIRAPPSDSASTCARPTTSTSRGSSAGDHQLNSAIRSCVRRPTTRRRPGPVAARTRRWPQSATRIARPTGVPGIAPQPQPGRTRKWQASCCAAPSRRLAAPGSPPERRSSSGPPS